MASKPQVLILSEKELASAFENNPFPNNDGKTVHIFFLKSTPDQSNLEQLAALKSVTEAYRLIGDFFYLYAPNGIGRSKLAANLEKALGVSATGRNWNTVSKLNSMTKNR